MDTQVIDMDLNNLLISWKLPHLYNLLKENRITVEVLKVMEKDHIRKLFHNHHVGDEALFEYNLKIYKKSFDENRNLERNPQNAQLSCIKIAANDHKICKFETYSVLDILEDTKSGKSILKYYKEHNALHDEQRNLLVATICTYLQEKEIECSVSKCSDMEKEICSIFPTEKLEFYQSGKRGKLYNKLANLKRIQKGILTVKNSTTDATHSVNYEPEENYSIALKLLRTETITAEEFDLYWRQCAQYRFKQMSESNSTKEILKLWPEYGKPSGIHLIEIDFSLKYPIAKDLKTRWPYFEGKVLYYLKTKLSSAFVLKKLNQSTSSNAESKTFAILWSIHYLFPPQQKSSAEDGEKYTKKYTIVDSQDSFAVIAETQDELEAKLKLLKLQNKRIQPKLLIVGDVSNIKSISVYFDNLMYPFLTILNAVDILFKIFYVFNLQYPVESEIFYNFLQDFLYEIPLNKKSTKISTVKNEIINLNI